MISVCLHVYVMFVIYLDLCLSRTTFKLEMGEDDIQARDGGNIIVVLLSHVLL